MVRPTDINCVCGVFTVKDERGREGEAAQNYTGRYSQVEEMPWACSACSREEKQSLTECDAVWFGRTLPIFSYGLL